MQPEGHSPHAGSDADEEFLALLYKHFASPDYIAMIEAAGADNPFEERFREYVAHGLYDSDQVEEAAALHAENVSARRSFRGQFVEVLRDLALRITGADRELLEDVPVVLLPTQELNARVFQSPSGRPVIVLNHAVISNVQLLVRTVLAFMTWHDERPFCRDATQEQYARAIVALAEFVTTSQLAVLKPHLSALFPTSVSDFDKQVIMWSELVELFILLHEYGHVVGGHLNEAEDAPDSTAPLPEFPRRHLIEFEADEYAINRLVAVGEGKLYPRDVAFVAGLLLRFFTLCERLRGVGGSSDTHPPSVDRWDRVKSTTLVAMTPGAMATQLDSAFAAIEAHLL